MKLYSPSTRGFYLPGLTYADLPGDLIEIPEEYYDALLDGQAQGKAIVADQNGVPQLVTPAPDMSALRVAARAQVVALIDAREVQLTGGVPANERASWSAKEAAARTWLADQAQPVPALIAAEAAVVGETALAVAQRIVARADAWLPVTGAHTGHRRVAEAAIAAAATPAAVEAALDALREALA